MSEKKSTLPKLEKDPVTLPSARLIGARLREERESLGLSQEVFASKVGVHRNTQNKYESGLRAFDTSYMHSIKCIGVDTVYVLDGIRADTAQHFEAMLGLSSALLSALGYSDAEANKIKDDAVKATEPYDLENALGTDSLMVMQEVADVAIRRSPSSIRVRYGVNESTLTKVLEAVEQAMQDAGASLSPAKKAQAATMLYRQAAETGKVDAELAAMAVKLAG